ncbi:MAG: hypothetical protein U5N55_03535 [Cypionkella sp.]|nr:hypothetical protein [Cypionkella sp.]
MNVEEIRVALGVYNLTRVAEATGVNYYTLQRFASGKLVPRATTLDTIREYIKGGGK